MTDRRTSFQAYLDTVFFPERKKPKKRKQESDQRVYSRSDLTEEDCGKLHDPCLIALYLESEYPEILLTGRPETAEEDSTRRIAALLSAKATVVTESLGDSQRELLAFRSDSYLLFSPPAGPPENPTILVRKSAIKPLETILNLGKKEAKARPEQEPVPDTIIVSNPAELLVSRFFLPPRIQVSGRCFAARPASISSRAEFPQNTRTRSFTASWKFAGHPLAVRYHLSFLPSDAEELDRTKIAVIAAFFREALAFWAQWKRPVDAPGFSESTTEAASRSLYMSARIGGEGQQFRCLVEIPQGLIALVLTMSKASPLPAGTPAGIIDLIRANDALFMPMRNVYRKVFLSPPAGPAGVDGITVHAILSIADEPERGLIIQNFLIPRYELQCLPLFFYYHEAIQTRDGETRYRLKSAFPLTRGEIETHLSDAQREEWRYLMEKGCGHRISSVLQLAKLNTDAVLRLAQEGASGKILLTAKTMGVLRSEILVPLEERQRKTLEEVHSRTEDFGGLKDAPPRVISELLARIDTRTVALACTEWDEVLKILERGMSRGRRSDIQAEIEVVRTQRDRGEIPIQDFLDAKGHLAQLAREYASLSEDSSV